MVIPGQGKGFLRSNSDSDTMDSGKYVGRREGDTFTATLSIKGAAFASLFLCVWLCGWAMGEVQAITEIYRSLSAGGLLAVDFFTVFWLLGWTIGGMLALGFLLYSNFAREVVEASPEGLSIRRELLFYRSEFMAKARDVGNIEIEDDVLSVTRSDGGREYFGAPLTDADKAKLTAELLEVAPWLGEAPKASLVESPTLSDSIQYRSYRDYSGLGQVSEFRFHNKPSLFIIFFQLFWAGGWSTGITSSFNLFSNPTPARVGLCLALCLPAIGIVASILYQLRRATLTIGVDKLKWSTKLFGLGRERSMPKHDVSGFEFVDGKLKMKLAGGRELPIWKLEDMEGEMVVKRLEKALKT